MSKLLDWLVKEPKTATTQELELQAENAAQAFRAAQEAANDAEKAFDLDPSTESAALKAREAVTRAELHRNRAGRLLAARRDQDAEQARVDLAKRKEELLPQLAEAYHKSRVDLPEATFRAFMTFIETYAQEFEHERVTHDLERQVARIISDLEGITYDEASKRVSQNTGPYFHVLRERFRALPRAEDGSPLRFAQNIIHQEFCK